jgi:hypothetical protein
MKSTRKRRLLATLLIVPALAAIAVAQEAPVPLADRARGAERVVVGRVTAVNPMWSVNEFGDRLIVSRVTVAVDETLRGQAQQTLEVEIEGGTIGEVTLHVSDLEPVAAGDRAVFYLARSPRGAWVPHLRGQGLLKLDRADRVRGSNVTLDDVRRTARQVPR